MPLLDNIDCCDELKLGWYPWLTLTHILKFLLKVEFLNEIFTIPPAPDPLLLKLAPPAAEKLVLAPDRVYV